MHGRRAEPAHAAIASTTKRPAVRGTTPAGVARRRLSCEHPHQVCAGSADRHAVASPAPWCTCEYRAHYPLRRNPTSEPTHAARGPRVGAVMSRRLSGNAQDPLATAPGTPTIITFISGEVPVHRREWRWRPSDSYNPPSVPRSLPLWPSADRPSPEPRAPRGVHPPRPPQPARPRAPARAARPARLGDGDEPSPDGLLPAPYLTDHERYVRHHQRLASAP